MLAEATAFVEKQKIRDTLPSPMTDIQRYQLKEIDICLERIAFYKYGIGQVILGVKSYEDLYGEEEVSESESCFYSYWFDDVSPEQAITDLKRNIRTQYDQLRSHCQVTTHEDLLIVLDKIHVYKLHGLRDVVGVD